MQNVTNSTYKYTIVIGHAIQNDQLLYLECKCA